MIDKADESANASADFNYGQLPDSHAGIQRLWKIAQKLLKATTKLCEDGGGGSFIGIHNGAFWIGGSGDRLQCVCCCHSAHK